MRRCELCKSPATVSCDSDQASLCWDCDLKVHGANFLVARHSRILLCSVCQSPTPWSATGAKLCPTITVCERCTGHENVAVEEESEGGNNDEIDYDEEEFDFSDDGTDQDEEAAGESDDEEEAGESDDEDNDNQVVPLASATSPSGSSEVLSTMFIPPGTEASASLKRSRESSSDPCSNQEGLGALNTHRYDSAAVPAETMIDGENATAADYARPAKDRRTGNLPIHDRTNLVIGMISRIQREVVSGHNMPAAIIGLCKLCKCAEMVDLDSSAA